VKKSKAAPPLPFPLPDGVKMLEMVAYYHDGWHYGRLVEQKGHELAVLDGRKPSLKEHKIWVDLTDVKKIEN